MKNSACLRLQKERPCLHEYFNQPRPQKKKMGWEEIAETRMNIVVGFCTHCGARMRLVEINTRIIPSAHPGAGCKLRKSACFIVFPLPLQCRTDMIMPKTHKMDCGRHHILTKRSFELSQTKVFRLKMACFPFP